MHPKSANSKMLIPPRQSTWCLEAGSLAVEFSKTPGGGLGPPGVGYMPPCVAGSPQAVPNGSGGRLFGPSSHSNVDVYPKKKLDLL